MIDIGVARELQQRGAFLRRALCSRGGAALGQLVPDDGSKPQSLAHRTEPVAIALEELALRARP